VKHHIEAVRFIGLKHRDKISIYSYNCNVLKYNRGGSIIMPIFINWANEERTIIHHIYEGDWTLAELHTSRAEVADYLDTVTHPVDMIIDLRQSMKIPQSFMSEMQRMDQNAHPNSRHAVIVGGNKLIQMLVNVLQRVYKRSDTTQVSFVSTIEEAYTILGNVTAD